MLKTKSAGFIILLGTLVAIPPLSTDVGLPAYGNTAASFGITPASVALTLSFFMFGFAIGPLFYGPASEKFGRRPVLLAGLGLYLLTSILCTITPSFHLLLGSRLIQGFAASVGTVLAIACVRDSFDGPEGQRKIAYMMMINGLMPVTAPSVGAVILRFGDWRTIYGLMVVCAVLLLYFVRFQFGETIRKTDPAALRLRDLVKNYLTVIRHPVSFRASLINGFGFASLFAFISGSPIVFMGHMGIPAQAYGILIAIPVVGTISGTFSGNLLQRFQITSTRILCLSLILMVLATGALLALCLSDSYLVVPMVALICVSNFSMGMLGPCASFGAVRDLPQLAGSASAILASLQMLLGAGASTLMAGLFHLIGPAAMASGMFGFAVLAGLTFLTNPRLLDPVHATDRH